MSQHMSMISDTQWQVIRPIVGRSSRPRVGRKPADDRQVLEAFFWVVRNGSRWQDLPEEFPSARTCQRRLQEWRDKDTWQKIWQAYLERMTEDQQRHWASALNEGGFGAKQVDDIQEHGANRRVGRPPWWIDLAKSFWQNVRSGRLSAAQPYLEPSHDAAPSATPPSSDANNSEPNTEDEGGNGKAESHGGQPPASSDRVNVRPSINPTSDRESVESRW